MAKKPSGDTGTRDLYVDLLEKILINDIYRDPPIATVQTRRRARRQGLSVVVHDPDQRDLGTDWPSVAHSMIGRKRMRNLRQCVEDALRAGVPGDFIETGVWRGGACILMRGILRAWGVTDRTVWVADSFAGLPPPNADKYAADAGDKHHKQAELAVSLDQVKANFATYGLLDNQVGFLKGWFSETLPTAPIERLAVIRLDGDMYESTMDGFNNLYHKLSPGGYLIVDDYHAVPACKVAVHDFIATLDASERPEIREIDGSGVYWQRPSAAKVPASRGRAKGAAGLQDA